MRTAAPLQPLTPSRGHGTPDSRPRLRVRFVGCGLADADHRAIARYVAQLIRDSALELHAVPGVPASLTESGELAGRDGIDARRAPEVSPIPDGATYAKAEQLMARYQVSAKFVRKYAVELGATRLSAARNSKLRYHLPTADAFIAAHRKQRERRRAPGPRGHPRPRTHTVGGAPLVDFV